MRAKRPSAVGRQSAEPVPRPLARARGLRDLGIRHAVRIPTTARSASGKSQAFIAELEPRLSERSISSRPTSRSCIAAFCRRSCAATARRCRVTQQVRDHASDGSTGSSTVTGPNTRRRARLPNGVTDRLLSKLQRAAVPCHTATTALPGGGIRDVGFAIAEARRDHDAGLPSDTIPHLIAAYGSRYRDVLELAADRPDWRTRIAKDSPVIGAQLVHAVRKEMALTLADVVLRRTPLGALGHPGSDALEAAAAIVGGGAGLVGPAAAGRNRRRERVLRDYGTLNALKT